MMIGELLGHVAVEKKQEKKDDDKRKDGEREREREGEEKRKVKMREAQRERVLCFSLHFDKEDVPVCLSVSLSFSLENEAR